MSRRGRASHGDTEESSEDSEDDLDELKQLSRNDSHLSVGGGAGNDELMSMLSYATVGVSNEADGEFDIDTYREDCWRQISDATRGDGISGLAGELGDVESAGEEANRIIVGIRTRPANDHERRLGMRGCVEHLEDGKNLIIRKFNWNYEPYVMKFAFDHAFNEESSQDQVFANMGWKALKNAFSGYNVSIFAYGQTGSGKSHSMIGTAADPGLIRRIGEFLFEFMDRGEKELGYKYRTTVSACEIYCENVRDLLVLGDGASTASASQDDIVANIQGQDSLKIREGVDGVYVEGQSKVEIRSNAEMAGIIFAAIENRVVRATDMNAESSRSHLIFTIDFTQTQVSGQTARETTTKSKINLIDLAGSERARSTGASGEGLREGANINKSLSTLGRVISTLAYGGPKDHVPYRDSKLTYILKDSLGGDSKTSMLATISPSEINYEETVSTLRYAASVKRIETSASQHLEQEAGEMIKNLKEECGNLAIKLKDQEIQAAALAEEHRLALEISEKAQPVKVVHDEKEVEKLKAELTQMSKRAERYRTERDEHKTNLDAMEKRADRYHKERTISDDKCKETEEKLAGAERALSAAFGSPQKRTDFAGMSKVFGDEPSSPSTPVPQHNTSTAGENQEVERVKELEGLVNKGAGMHEDMKEGLTKHHHRHHHRHRQHRQQEGLTMHREAGDHFEQMSVALEQNALEEKAKDRAAAAAQTTTTSLDNDDDTAERLIFNNDVQATIPTNDVGSSLEDFDSDDDTQVLMSTSSSDAGSLDFEHLATLDYSTLHQMALTSPYPVYVDIAKQTSDDEDGKVICESIIICSHHCQEQKLTSDDIIRLQLVVPLKPPAAGAASCSSGLPGTQQQSIKTIKSKLAITSEDIKSHFLDPATKDFLKKAAR